MPVEKVSAKIADQELVLETGRMARQADGAVTVRYGDTIVLVTVVAAKELGEEVNFFPLSVDYREKTSAAGKFPGGFIKREGRPTEKEIVTARLIDRPIRPLFPDGFLCEVQIMAMVLSADGENDSDILAMIGASAALTISDIPFTKTLGSVRVGKIGEKFIVNPTHSQLEDSTLDLIISASEDAVIMLEGSAKEIPESTLIEAISYAWPFIQDIINLQKDLARKFGKEKRQVQLVKVDEGLYETFKVQFGKLIDKAHLIADKEIREEKLRKIYDEATEQFQNEHSPAVIRLGLEKLEKNIIRHKIITTGKRSDGRGPEEIRPITCEIDILPRTHGSALFTRGQTQSLATTTLGTSEDEQRVDGLSGELSKPFMLHYNFPPFSVGEIRMPRGPGRREIGHGLLAERSLKAILPPAEKFPYTIRLVSDILESNGSSSMATVCAGTLALMDAGVPISAPVAGISIGLVKEEEKVVLLTDILGVEDQTGDLDFKLAGTDKGVTGFQMDMKVEGLSLELLKQIVERARAARMVILEKIKEAIAQPRTKLSTYAPRIKTIRVKPDRIRDVIGPGGKVVRKIVEETGVKIDIEDDGKILIASPDEEALSKAIQMIMDLTAEPEVGKIYLGRVTRIMNFGAFVEILPGQEGLIHISQLEDRRVEKVEDVLKENDRVMVKLIEIDNQGRLNLSRKQALAEQGKKESDKKGQR